MLNDPPTAIACANDMLAIGCMKYLLNTGIKVPDTVAVTGFDNISFALMYEPALTTVSIPIDKMALSCLAMLKSMIDNSSYPKKSLILKTELIIRSSTDHLAPIELQI